ncbi:MAG: HAD family phosphatase [Phycisphaeraceae bacterium]|nr:HAD family phosphatase [Phycisphaeraceae bacterium]
MADGRWRMADGMATGRQGDVHAHVCKSIRNPPSTIRHPIRLVIFDLGGVMVKLAGSWEKACRIADVPQNEKMIPLTQFYHQLMAQHVHAHEIGALDGPQFDRELAAALQISVEQAHALHMAIIVEPYPGIEPVLAALRAAGIATACLSNTNADHWAIMTGKGYPASLPLDQLDHHFASHLLQMRKPNDEIYARVEQLTGLAPAEILFFEDTPANVEAALRRGWISVRIDPKADPMTQVTTHLKRLGILNG